MSTQEISRVGKRGTIVIPAELRRRLGLEEGAYVILEEAADGLLIRGAAIVPLEVYSPRRKAEFLLSNAIDAEDYSAAAEEVRTMGLDPNEIPHRKPAEN
jgi:AbrB family looped-hinge helix DNA binding protein